jgi:hypothetical protein
MSRVIPPTRSPRPERAFTRWTTPNSEGPLSTTGGGFFGQPVLRSSVVSLTCYDTLPRSKPHDVFASMHIDAAPPAGAGGVPSASGISCRHHTLQSPCSVQGRFASVVSGYSGSVVVAVLEPAVLWVLRTDKRRRSALEDSSFPDTPGLALVYVPR